MNDYNQRMKKILSLYWESTRRFGRRERYSIFSDHRLSDRQKIDAMKNDCLASYRRHIPHLKALYENEFEKLPNISDADSLNRFLNQSQAIETEIRRLDPAYANSDAQRNIKLVSRIKSDIFSAPHARYHERERLGMPLPYDEFVRSLQDCVHFSNQSSEANIDHFTSHWSSQYPPSSPRKYEQLDSRYLAAAASEASSAIAPSPPRPRRRDMSEQSRLLSEEIAREQEKLEIVKKLETLKDLRRANSSPSKRATSPSSNDEQQPSRRPRSNSRDRGAPRDRSRDRRDNETLMRLPSPSRFDKGTSK